MKVVALLLLYTSLSMASQVSCPRSNVFATSTSMKISSVTSEDETPRCDQTSGLNPTNENRAWFRLEGSGGTGIISRQPTRQDVCGTTYPGWIQGDVPHHFGMTTGKLCYKNPPSGFTCPDGFACHDYFKVDMYNCDGRYLLYHLHLPPASSNPPIDCEKAFCTTEIGPCELRNYKIVMALPEMTVTHRLTADSQTRCDESADYVDGKTWIRLQGSSGTEIIHEQPSGGTGVCGTTNAGWIVGKKPTTVGTVARRTLCYSKGSDGKCCDGRPIDVMNCESFMIYRLHKSSPSSSSSSSSSLSSSAPSSSCTAQCCKAFCVERPVYDVCEPRSYDTISATQARQNDNQYADGKTWWRIEEDHTMRVISGTKPSKSGQCNSDNPGWMEGTVPKVSDGIVQRTLCYFDGSSTACPNPRNIDVANCGSFLLYRLYKASTPPRAAFCIDPVSPDPCYYLPCQRGGTCTPHENKSCYKCSCPPGMSGENCEIDNTGVDECASNPCQNGGTCHDGIGRYSCVCANGFTGTNCETEIDRCSPNPCQNGGTCTKKGDSYTCECIDTHTGDNCETSKPKDPCDPNPCKNFGECKDGVCECMFGWTGKTCEDDTAILEILNGIARNYDDDDDGGGGGCGFFCFLGGVFSGIGGALSGLFSGLGGLLNGLGSGLGGLSNSLGNLGNSLNNLNNARNPSNSKPKVRCPRMNVGSALKGLQRGLDKCKKKYDNKKCTLREKAKPDKPQKPEKPKPTGAPNTNKPTQSPTQPSTTEPTKKPETACTATCSAVQDPKHGKKIGDKTSCGDSVTFNCESGYKLSGCAEPQCKITCQDDGQWNSQPPTCIKVTCGGLVTLSSTHSSRMIEKSASSSITDCNWAIRSDTPASITLRFIDFNFPNSISAQDTCTDYIEIVMGTRREKYCGEKPSNDVIIANQGLIRFHSSSSSSSFKVDLSLQNSCPLSSGLFRRSPPGCQCTARATNTKEWPDYLPILYDVHSKVKLPNDAGKLTLNQGEKLAARCSNTEFLQYPGEIEISIECDTSGKLTITVPPKLGQPQVINNGKTFKDISCKTLPAPEIWENSNKLHIGWKENAITQMTITYDNTDKRPLYVKHTIFGPIAQWKENDKPRPGSFKNLEKYLKSKKYPVAIINKLKADYEDVSQDGYTIKSQFSKIDALGAGLGSKFIDCCEDAKYLVKGHLAPNADFGFQSWRDATFFMVNVAPQWQGINAGNWGILEQEIRNYAKSRETSIIVYTGVYGNLILDTHPINIPQADSPVPTHFWKIVYDKGLNAAVAFVILNNPYATLDADKYPTGADRICPTQCDFLDKGQTLVKGIVMCCSYDDLKAKIGSVPTLAGLSNLADSANNKAIDFGLRLKARIN